MYIKGSHRCLHNPSEERYRWIGLCPEEAVQNGEDKYVVDALLKLDAWNSTYGQSEV